MASHRSGGYPSAAGSPPAQPVPSAGASGGGPNGSGGHWQRRVMDQYEEDRSRRIALERELEELQLESERGKQVLDGLSEKIQTLRAEVERQRRTKPERGCASCHAVTLQVDAAAQSLLGSAGHVARALLRDSAADRSELLETVLRYLEPVKHLDPDLEDLYARATASLRKAAGARQAAAHSSQGGGASLRDR